MYKYNVNPIEMIEQQIEIRLNIILVDITFILKYKSHGR